MMKAAGAAAVLLCLVSTELSGQAMQEMKGVKANQDCLEPSKIATGTVKTCPLSEERTRIWCPNGRVFDRHTRETRDLGIAVLRSICEMSQLPG